MRAAMMLEALVHHFNVFLLAFQFYRERVITDEHLKFLRGCCAGIEIIPRAFLQSQSDFSPIYWFKNVAFDSVHVFKLSMAPLARLCLKADRHQRPFCVLDLDDFESKTQRRIAALEDLAGNAEAAARQRAAAEKWAAMERCYIPLFDRVYVCSEYDRLEIGNVYDCLNKVSVVPNAVCSPELTDPPSECPYTFLFTGTMAYLPNADGVRFFCREVLPQLRTGALSPFRIVIAGSKPSPEVRSLASEHPEVSVTGEVPEMEPYFSEASAVIVPIRAGGGTRVKILEAWSYRRPVVSTSLGAEGLDATHGKQLLIADTPAEFSQACLNLMNEPEKARRIAVNGYEWVRSRYTSSNVREALEEAMAGHLRPTIRLSRGTSCAYDGSKTF